MTGAAGNKKGAPKYEAASSMKANRKTGSWKMWGRNYLKDAMALASSL